MKCQIVNAQSKVPSPGTSDAMSRREMLKYSGVVLSASLVPQILGGSLLTEHPVMQNNTPADVKQKNALGFVLSTEQWAAPDLLQQGIVAEAAGFDMVLSSDHIHPWQDNEGHSSLAWVVLSAIAQRTSKVFFGTGVTCPTYRYRPAVVAESFASLSQLSPGRVFLGVGSGEALNEQASGGGWGKYAERAARLIEAVQIIRKAWQGDYFSFDGKYYQIPKFKLYDTPPQPIPIYIAASGPKSMTLAGTYGDGLITDPKRALDPELREVWATAAKNAGRDPQSLPILCEQMVFVGKDTDPELKQAAELWRFDPKNWSQFVNNPDPVAIQKGADAIVPLEEVYNNWIVGDDPQIHATRLQGLFKGGITQLYIHSAQRDQQKVIDFYGKQVLPLVRSQLAASASSLTASL